MAIRLPWWLSPWREVRACRAANLRLLGRLTKYAEDLDHSHHHSSRLESELRSLRSLSAQDGMLSTQTPEFVIVGIPRPGMGVRLVASRDLGALAFGMTPTSTGGAQWKITATLDKTLFIDKPSYPEAFGHMSTIWRNWERDAEREQHKDMPRLPAGVTPVPRPPEREIHKGALPAIEMGKDTDDG
jgi:hypothetical protein